MAFSQQVYRAGFAGDRYRRGRFCVTPLAIDYLWQARQKHSFSQVVTPHRLKEEGTSGLVKLLTIQAALLECQRRLETFD